MNFNRAMIKTTALLVVVFGFVACDDDFSTIGGEIIENPTGVDLREVEVAAYSKKINSVQTNGLPANLLGVYNHPLYGQTEASVLSQLSLTTDDPDFGEETKLDSVVLHVPYFSTEEEPDEAGNKMYRLDSIFGESPFKLSVYESGYYLSGYDPDTDFEQAQKYYSDQQEVFEENLVNGPLYENDNFIPSENRITDYTIDGEGEADTIVSPPALRIKLPVEFFEQKILAKEGTSVLSGNSNFRNYFRGLFFKAEALNGEGNMILFSLRGEEAGITMYYTHEVEEENSEGETETVEKRASYKFAFGSNIVNTFQGEFPEDLRQEIQNSDPEEGAENLYLKGGEGSMAIVELFSEEGVLEEVRSSDWLINEANLSFYVNQDKLNGVNEPERIYLYDLDNNTILADYSFTKDFIGGAIDDDPLNSLTEFSSRLERDEDENGLKYTVDITQHVNNVINKDSTNVKIGVVVTQNINDVVTTALRDTENETVKRIPRMSVLSPKGTVLYGNREEDEDKRLKLRIYYTDINQ
ncbi:DUF4270 domain-containing protein [Salegentibacter chungangensis]|uniref:DUF4270 domain-containing protein n=1 Tax=Salegentibacter chungangensis TaxID=1335724 RepID=A0ABW3NM71_9FLAO